MTYPNQPPTSGGIPSTERDVAPNPLDRQHDTSGHDSGGKQDQAKQVASQAGDRAKDVAGTAQREAEAVKGTAKAEASDVADTAKKEAGNVAHEAGRQSRRLVDEGTSELQSQAVAGQQRLAEMARSYGSELESMTQHSDESGPVTELANSASRMLDDAANWLERNEPSDVLDSVRRYAARNPWQFLAISAGVGFIGARVVRGLQKSDGDARPELDRPTAPRGGGAPAAVGAPAWEGGPRRGPGERAEPGSTPGTTVPPMGESGAMGTSVAPATDLPGGPRGL